MGRPVTVTVFPPLSEGRTREGFDRAAATAQRLGVHPSVITIHEWGHAPDGRPWIVTDPQPADSVDTLLTMDGPLEVERALQVGVLLAGALETAHRAGIVHGDLSPARLVFGPHGEPMLAETGLAPFAVLPGLGALNNPVRYHAPPEVLERTEISPATDVYSLATTVYALLAGRAPQQKSAEVTDSNASLLLRVLQMPVPPIGRPGLPPGLEEALRGPLSPSPHKRPQQAIEMAWLLQDAQRRAGLAITEPVVLDLDDIATGRSADGRSGRAPTPPPPPWAAPVGGAPGPAAGFPMSPRPPSPPLPPSPPGSPPVPPPPSSPASPRLPSPSVPPLSAPSSIPSPSVPPLSAPSSIPSPPVPPLSAPSSIPSPPVPPLSAPSSSPASPPVPAPPLRSPSIPAAPSPPASPPVPAPPHWSPSIPAAPSPPASPPTPGPPPRSPSIPTTPSPPGSPGRPPLPSVPAARPAATWQIGSPASGVPATDEEDEVLSPELFAFSEPEPEPPTIFPFSQTPSGLGIPATAPAAEAWAQGTVADPGASASQPASSASLTAPASTSGDAPPTPLWPSTWHADGTSSTGAPVDAPWLTGTSHTPDPSGDDHGTAAPSPTGVDAPRAAEPATPADGASRGDEPAVPPDGDLAHAGALRSSTDPFSVDDPSPEARDDDTPWPVGDATTSPWSNTDEATSGSTAPRIDADATSDPAADHTPWTSGTAAPSQADPPTPWADDTNDPPATASWADDDTPTSEPAAPSTAWADDTTSPPATATPWADDTTSDPPATTPWADDDEATSEAATSATSGLTDDRTTERAPSSAGEDSAPGSGPIAGAVGGDDSTAAGTPWSAEPAPSADADSPWASAPAAGAPEGALWPSTWPTDADEPPATPPWAAPAPADDAPPPAAGDDGGSIGDMTPMPSSNGSGTGDPPPLPSFPVVQRPPELDQLPAWYTDPLPNDGTRRPDGDPSARAGNGHDTGAPPGSGGPATDGPWNGLPGGSSSWPGPPGSTGTADSARGGPGTAGPWDGVPGSNGASPGTAGDRSDTGRSNGTGDGHHGNGLAPERPAPQPWEGLMGPDGRPLAPGGERLPGAGDELRSLFGEVVGDLDDSSAGQPPAGLGPEIGNDDPLGPPSSRPPLDLSQLDAPLGPSPYLGTTAPTDPTVGNGSAAKPPTRLPRRHEVESWPASAPGAKPTPRLPRAGETAADLGGDAAIAPRLPRAEPVARPAAAAGSGPPALPLIILIAVVAVLVAGVAWLVLTGDEAGAPASERPDAEAGAGDTADAGTGTDGSSTGTGAPAAPTGVQVSQGPDGVRVTWPGSADGRYVVTVLTAEQPPKPLAAATGTSALVPTADLGSSGAWCITVSATQDGTTPGPASEPACAPGVSIDAMRGA